jgi:hypothetical protein
MANHQQQGHRNAADGPQIDGDFDFEKANEQFRESVDDIGEKMAKTNLEENAPKGYSPIHCTN